jgi:hypothetical protein
VFLLRPAWSGSGMPAPVSVRAGLSAVDAPDGVLIASVHFLHQPADRDLLERCRGPLSNLLHAHGASALGWYVTEPAQNDFPRLPVRSGESVLANLALFPNLARWQEFECRGVQTHDLMPLLQPWLASRSEVHHLLPAARSAIRA